MAIVDPLSLVYMVVSGRHKGKTCVIRVFDIRSVFLGVVFMDGDLNKIVRMKKCKLAEIETPGWPKKISGQTYGISEYFEKHEDDGTCMLRTSYFAQPGALKKGDVLASDEIVDQELRQGHNNSTLIHLSRTGWVEPASRLPIALQGNEKFKFPADLKKGDRLVTSCLIVKNPISAKLNWITVFLRKESCDIEVPSCIPLALS